MSETAQEILGFLLWLTIFVCGLIGTIAYFSNESDKINTQFKLSCIEKGYIYDGGDCTVLVNTNKK